MGWIVLVVLASMLPILGLLNVVDAELYKRWHEGVKDRYMPPAYSNPTNRAELDNAAAMIDDWDSVLNSKEAIKRHKLPLYNVWMWVTRRGLWI